MKQVKNKIKLLDAPVYRYWEALYKSFYSRSLYVDVGKRWTGLGLLYLFLVIAVFCIPLSVRVTMNLNQSFREQIIEPLLALPTVTVQQGELYFDKPMPYLIKNRKNEVALIVDNTGTVNQFTPEYPHLNILITKDKFYFKIPTPQIFKQYFPDPNPEAPLSQPFGKESNLVFDGKKIIADNKMERFKYISAFLVYPVLLTMFFSMVFILFLVFAFLGELFARIFFSFPLKFRQSCRLFMVASTPALVFLLALLFLDAVFLGSGYILTALLVFYFAFAISALKTDSQHLVKK